MVLLRCRCLNVSLHLASPPEPLDIDFLDAELQWIADEDDFLDAGLGRVGYGLKASLPPLSLHQRLR